MVWLSWESIRCDSEWPYWLEVWRLTQVSSICVILSGLIGLKCGDSPRCPASVWYWVALLAWSVENPQVSSMCVILSGLIALKSGDSPKCPASVWYWVALLLWRVETHPSVQHLRDTEWLYWSEVYRLTQVSSICVILSGLIALKSGDSPKCPASAWYWVALLVWGVETHPGVQHLCDTEWLYWLEVWRLTQVSSICVILSGLIALKSGDSPRCPASVWY